ncbi:hypothetical protein AOCH_003354 [Aspergillus ochraceoroseus]|uniref:Uncharacterized protein n=1 Tax=Aspergillus ochraceoroseus TaxID=138278 RepID=A0A0F8U2E5_9EURO|nr:hypothetical protein AOCH_003354 [Aspergillus ochraceoroseus]
MDGFSINSEVPPEYRKVKWLADIFVVGMGAGWVVHYVLMVYTSIKHQTYCLNIMPSATPSEWHHSPLVAQNGPLIFMATTALWVCGQFAVAMQLGPPLAYTWGAIVCQLLISVGQVCQLLNRNSTRGASYSLWLSRFFGSTSTIGFWTLRYLYWPEAFSWLGEPILIWAIAVFFASEFTYGYCFYRIQYQENLSHGSECKRK